MGFALDLAYRASGSYGFSICVLSALVNLAILPAYYLAERWKTREREIQSRMKPELDSIRAGASGYEAFLLSGYVHRRHGYRPWHSARAGIGVLIQIPFFFAAYHLLSSLGALAGTPFLLIRDLGSPDGLVDLGFGSENLLPLVYAVFSTRAAR